MSNRTIKFRVWDKVLKYMSYDVTLYSNGWVDYEDREGQEFPKVHPDEIILMQYAGINDKHNKEIFEGDIIKIGTNERFCVTWHEYKQEFTFKGYGGGYYPNTYRGATRDDMYGWEVIGNIYETKELLKMDA